MHNSRITQLSACLVEISIDDVVVAKAVRADTESNWYIGALVDAPYKGQDRVMMNVSEIRYDSQLPEVRQRKLVLAMLQSLADSL